MYSGECVSLEDKFESCKLCNITLFNTKVININNKYNIHYIFYLIIILHLQ